MSELETFRDHCRAMSKAEHNPSRPCRTRRIINGTGGLGSPEWFLSCHDTTSHTAHQWSTERYDWTCPGLCGGCHSDADRALWTRLADEIDAYMGADDDEGPDLFGGAS